MTLAILKTIKKDKVFSSFKNTEPVLAIAQDYGFGIFERTEDFIFLNGFQDCKGHEFTPNSIAVYSISN